MAESRYHAKTYEPYDGPRNHGLSRAPIIARRELIAMWRIKWVRRLVLLALTPALFISVRIYVEQIVKRLGADISLGGDYYLSLFQAQIVFVVLLMAAVGAGLIAKDTASGAYQLYFSRPLGPRDYLLGKLMAVVGAMATITLGPALIVSLAQFFLVPDLPFLTFLLTVGRALAYSLIVAFASGVIILLLSAYGRRARNVGLFWLALFIVSEIVRAALYTHVFDNEAVQLLSIHSLFVETGRVVFGAPEAMNAALIVLLCVTGVALVALWSRLEALERRES